MGRLIVALGKAFPYPVALSYPPTIPLSHRGLQSMHYRRYPMGRFRALHKEAPASPGTTLAICNPYANHYLPHE